MARSLVFAIVFLSLAALGYAGTKQSSVEPRRISLQDLWTAPDDYGGDYVVVVGTLRLGELPYFESAVTVNNVKPVIYIRFDGVDASYPTQEFRDCVDGSAVRVYGRFRFWDQYESMLDDVYRVEAIISRRPSSDDVECFVSPSKAPLS